MDFFHKHQNNSHDECECECRLESQRGKIPQMSVVWGHRIV